jgi:quercetin dioxygenase-like cupin family protein
VSDFPDFVKHPANRIAAASQFTETIEGYVFDGADGSQVALWICHADRVSREHAHPFDEWVFVLEGTVTATVAGATTVLCGGDELHIPKGAQQTMAFTAGTRSLHAFGGKRARRERER